MKKRVLCAAIASMMVLSMAACSSGSTAATTAETKASEAETTTVAASSEKAEDATAAGTEGGTLIVGFDQDFPPMGFLGDNGERTFSSLCNKNDPRLYRPAPARSVAHGPGKYFYHPD